MQMIFQDPYASLNPRMRVGSIITEPIRALGLAYNGKTNLRVQQLMELVGLNPRFATWYPHEFSGGQRQRIGIARALAAEPDIALAGEAATGDEVQRLCRELRPGPDVVLLDLAMPGPPATETVAYLRAHCPRARVIMLTAHDEDAWVRGLVALGVAGYVLKDEALEAVAGAIRAVMAGGAWFSPAVMATLAAPAPADRGDEPDLTGRERDLLNLLAQGRDNTRIADTLHLGENTVRNYVSRLYKKIGVANRPAAVV